MLHFENYYKYAQCCNNEIPDLDRLLSTIISFSPSRWLKFLLYCRIRQPLSATHGTNYAVQCKLLYPRAISVPVQPCTVGGRGVPLSVRLLQDLVAIALGQYSASYQFSSCFVENQGDVNHTYIQRRQLYNQLVPFPKTRTF